MGLLFVVAECVTFKLSKKCENVKFCVDKTFFAMVVFCNFALCAKTACTSCENSLHSLLQYLANENDIKKYFTFCHHPVGSLVQ